MEIVQVKNNQSFPVVFAIEDTAAKTVLNITIGNKTVNIMLEDGTKFAQGITPVAKDVWELMRKDARVSGYLKSGTLAEIPADVAEATPERSK